jgi:pimeloyl-ACP methyl ester carboxylesterase
MSKPFTQRDVALSAGPLRIAEAGTGRPLLHLHSAGGPRFSPVVQSLTARHRVTCPFMPGFDGTATLPAVKTIPDVADLYADFIAKEFGGEKVDVMAESLGGWVALWLAVRHPALVDHLVLEGPAGLRAGGKGGLPADPAERHRQLYAVPERAPQETRSNEQLTANRTVVLNYSANTAFDQGLAEKLPEIQARTLIVMGYKEQIIPMETGHLLKAKIPHSHLTYVFGAAHAIEFDQPQRVGTLVADFLERGESFIVREPQVA